MQIHPHSVRHERYNLRGVDRTKMNRGMTPRERVKNAISFKKVDMVPWIEVFFDETLFKFISEGLPVASRANVEWSLSFGGSLLQNWPVLTGFDPSSYFGCTNLWGCAIPIDVGPIRDSSYGR